MPDRGAAAPGDRLEARRGLDRPKVTAMLPMIRERLGSLQEVSQAIDHSAPLRRRSVRSGARLHGYDG